MLNRTQSLWNRFFGRQDRNTQQSHRAQAIKRRRVFLESLESRSLLATFHVALTGSDANPGTTVAPFRSIQAAVNAASTTVDGNDMVNVATGVYNTAGVDLKISVTSSANLDNLRVLGGWNAAFITRNPSATPTDYYNQVVVDDN